jgi:hypothetical protein
LERRELARAVPGEDVTKDDTTPSGIHNGATTGEIGSDHQREQESRHQRRFGQTTTEHCVNVMLFGIQSEKVI